MKLNYERAGILVKYPTMNAQNSQIAAIVIEGPTSDNASPILYSILN